MVSFTPLREGSELLFSQGPCPPLRGCPLRDRIPGVLKTLAPLGELRARRYWRPPVTEKRADDERAGPLERVTMKRDRPWGGEGGAQGD